MYAQDEPTVVYRDHWAPEHMNLVCGIANAGGGTLIIESSEKVYTAGRRKMRRPFEQLPRLIERELGLQCTAEPVLNGTDLYLEILIPPASAPLSRDGEYWLLSSGHIVSTSRDAVQATLDGAPIPAEDDETPGNSWETRLQPEIQQGDLNARQFMELARLQTDVSNPLTSTIEDVFEKHLDYLSLRDMRTKSMNNAGVLLLHNHPEQIVPGAWMHMELVTQDDRVLLHNDFSGSLAYQVEDSLRLLYEQYLPVAIATSGSADNPVVNMSFPPRKVVHDTLLSALVNRNYESERPICIIVHSDNLTFRMPSAATGTAPRNPIFTRALHLLGYLDSKDASFEQIVAQCTDMGAEPPIIEYDDDETTVVFSLDSQNMWQMSAPPRLGFASGVPV